MKRHTKTTINTILAAFALLAATGCHNQNALTEKTAAKQGPAAAATVAMNGETAGVSTPAVANARPAAGLGGHVVGSKYVTTAATDTVAADDVMLLIDSGAVRRDVQISIVSTTEEHTGEIPSHMENLTAGGAVYRMLPDGQKFEKDITIAMRYDSTALPHGYTADDIYTFFYNEDTRMWQKVERDSVDTQHQIVYSRTNHFTDYINGVLKVPESSDVTTYTPTSIKDLKAADPLEGITMIAPPEANNMGTANLSYPLTIPAGRHGMQPQLSVNYNSAGGSGILGLGWSLPISEISVDTRRGVPLYSPNEETETYILDGEVLVTSYTEDGLRYLNKPAYRSQWKPRGTSSVKRFYLRTEGPFRRIERLGTNPKNYKWVVTDKNGIKYYYGEFNSTRLQDGNGNIAKWCLQRVVDTRGNAVLYEYKTFNPTDTKVGKQILLNKIKYTAHLAATGEPAKYSIDFHYAQHAKHDSVTSARYGFVEADAALLDHIDVMYDGRPVKYYYFGYKLGAYEKTMLCNIIEVDPTAKDFGCLDCGGVKNEDSVVYSDPNVSCDYDESFLDRLASMLDIAVRYYDCELSDTTEGYKDHWVKNQLIDSSVFLRNVYDRCYETESHCRYLGFQEHKFEYSEMPTEMFSNAVYITNAGLESDALKGPLFLASGSPGPIEGTGTKSWNVGGGLDVGVGYQTYIKSKTVGGGYNYNSTESEGLISLVDLNGDGRPDKIYKRNGTIYYRLLGADTMYSQETEIPNIDNFLYSESESDNWVVEGCLGATVGASFGLNWSYGTSAVCTYLCDMDGDGLPDIVDNGRTYYNRINDPEKPDFVAEGQDDGFIKVTSCDTVFLGLPVDQLLFADSADIKYTSPRRYKPNLENVRFWQAPYLGTIRIHDTIQMTQSMTGDGVRLIIQNNYRQPFLANAVITPGVDTSIIDTTIYVVEGQRIFFRMLSFDSRTADRLRWNPTITYIDNPGELDTFSYEDDFLISGDQQIMMPFKGKVEIASQAFIPGFSNPTGIKYQVYQEGQRLEGDTLSFDIHDDNSIHKAIISVEKEDKLQIKINASNASVPFNWSNIRAKCRIRIIENTSTDPEDNSFVCMDTQSNPDDTVYFFEYYPQILKLVNADEENDMYGDYGKEEYSKFGTMYRNWGQFGIKSPGELRVIHENMLNTQDLNNMPSESTAYEDLDDNPTITLNDPDNPEAHVNIGNNLPVYNPLAGTFFSMMPDFKHDCWSAYSDYAYIERGLVSNVPHPADGVTVEQMDASVSETIIPTQTPHAFAVNKTNYNESFGFTGNISVNLGLLHFNGGVSRTISKSRQRSDMMDLNGDGLPEAVSEISAQYTHPAGGLTNKKGFHGDDGKYLELSYDTVNGGSFGGSGIGMIWQPGRSSRTTTKEITCGVGSNISDTKGTGNSNTTWVDINGDGLPDKVIQKDGRIYYYQNIGYGFLPIAYFGEGLLRHSASKGFSGGTNLNAAFEEGWWNKEGILYNTLFGNGDLPSVTNPNIPGLPESTINRLKQLLAEKSWQTKLNVSLTAGFGASTSKNENDVAPIDLNGDGLPDRVVKYRNGYLVYFNTGNSFNGSYAKLYLGRRPDNISSSTDLSGALTAGVTLGWIPLKIEVNPKGGLSRGLSRTTATWMDMNADGIADYVWDAGDNYIGVKYSNLGEANRLTKVTLPSGGSYQMTYKTNDDGAESNMRHRVMESLAIKDNHMDSPVQRKSFEYRNRHYDRIERDDYGYDTVIIVEKDDNNADYRRIIREYHNQDYLFRGLCHDTRVIDAMTGDTLSGEYNEFRLFEIASGDLIPNDGPSCFGDGYPAINKSQTFFYNHDGERQITSQIRFGYTQYGNIDSVYVDGDVADPTDNYIAITKYDSIGDYIVSAVIEEKVSSGGTTYRRRAASYDTQTGEIQSLKFYINNSWAAVYDFQYDEYGNITGIDQPENHQNERFHIGYKYDDTLHMLPIYTTNSYGLESTAAYDSRWQKPLWTMSVNGAIMEYRYDSHGRLKELYAPLEAGTGRPTIRYEYYDCTPQTPAYWLDSCLWARTLNDNNGTQFIGTVTISDGLGRPRVVKREAAVNGQPKRIVSGWTKLDALGRKICEYYPTFEDAFAADTCINYNLATGSSTQYTYDALDRVTKTVFPDGTRSSALYTIDYDDDGYLRLMVEDTNQNDYTSRVFTNLREQATTTINAIGATTVIHYDPIGQLQDTRDPDGYSVSHEYDMLGRRTDRIHPSAGHTQWKYDAAGNLIVLTQNSGEQIYYQYDYKRPVYIEYPARPWNNVWYEYGQGGSGDIAGRIYRQQDATGVQEFRYDALGNVTYNRHTYVQPHSSNIFTLTTHWKYDSWGRVHNIVYPDGESVDYSYDFGGMLFDIYGDECYIKSIEYDHFGQRTRVVDGDGVVTEYTYSPLTRRLEHLTEQSNNTGETLQDNTYTYDNVGNITSIWDGGLNPRSQVYEYDEADRLIRSEGTIPNEHWTSGTYRYTSNYQYTLAGRMEHKSVSSDRYSSARGPYGVQYSNDYLYNDPDNPFAVTKIRGNYSPEYGFKWDANGNMVHAGGGDPHFERSLCWTEDNRLQAYMEQGDEGGIAAWYNYTAAGERNFKFTSPRLNMQQNASVMNAPSLIYPTLYASPLITLTKYGYTKHYFEEGRRVCSKLGGGFLRRVAEDEIHKPVEEIKYNYEEQHKIQQDGVRKTFGGCIGVEPRVIDDYDLLRMILEYRSEEKPFFYHSDHLGSAAYLTTGGQVTQTLNYLPYGEDWVDIQNNLDPRLGQYTFNGKEKDYESGFHYYGARYYWSEVLTGWLSVDPMADKYPSISPYNYCVWNPIKLVDPNGMDTIFSLATNHSDPTKKTDNIIIMTWVRTEGDTPGMVTICMHGSSQKVYMSDTEGTSENSQSAFQLAGYIKAFPEDFPDYNRNTLMNKPTIFLLYCCNTGQGDQSFAQQFSSEMQGIVIAPVGEVCIAKDGSHRMWNWIDEDKRIEQPWNVFYNGRKVTSFMGTLPQEWIKNLGGIDAATEKIEEMDRKRRPWE